MKCNHYYLTSEEKIFIGIAGPPSSGKDTLADSLNSVLINSSNKVHEYAREYVEKYGPPKSIFEQYVIYSKQFERENEIRSIYQVAICSSPRFLSWFYASKLLCRTDRREAELGVLSELYKNALKSLFDYSFIIYCEPLEYDDDGLRFQSKKDVKDIHNSITSFFDIHKINYLSLPAISVGERVRMVTEYIGAIEKVN